MITEILEALNTQYANNRNVITDVMLWLNTHLNPDGIEPSMEDIKYWFNKNDVCIKCGGSLLTTLTRTDNGRELVKFCPNCDIVNVTQQEMESQPWKNQN